MAKGKFESTWASRGLSNWASDTGWLGLILFANLDFRHNGRAEIT
jgi:hypothetical protein